jgi:hypothetical protein
VHRLVPGSVSLSDTAQICFAETTTCAVSERVLSKRCSRICDRVKWRPLAHSCDEKSLTNQWPREYLLNKHYTCDELHLPNWPQGRTSIYCPCSGPLSLRGFVYMRRCDVERPKSKVKCGAEPFRNTLYDSIAIAKLELRDARRKNESLPLLQINRLRYSNPDERASACGCKMQGVKVMRTKCNFVINISTARLSK